MHEYICRLGSKSSLLRCRILGYFFCTPTCVSGWAYLLVARSIAAWLKFWSHSVSFSLWCTIEQSNTHSRVTWLPDVSGCWLICSAENTMNIFWASLSKLTWIRKKLIPFSLYMLLKKPTKCKSGRLVWSDKYTIITPTLICFMHLN